MIYLDNAATTLQKPPEVGQAMLAALQTAGNPGRGAHEPTLHAARLVYAAPEEPGEAADPGYCRLLNGLGLTKTRILPHYQFIREHVLDGQKVEDIALADSKERHFLALPDGSYILCADGSETLYGKGWYFADGMMEEINEDEDVLPLR